MKTLSQICKDGRFTILISPLLLLTSVLPLSAASPNLLWEIGKADNDDREFALAPNGYTKFKEDGFFVAGRSQAKQDWPYVQPGPDDGWAGGRPHVFTVLFGVQSAPTAGDCKLRLDLVDTQGRVPPELRIEINGQTFRKRMPPGAGDETVFGQPAKGKEHKIEIDFPATLLRASGNEVSIATVSGSWIIYDWLGLEAPDGVKLSDAAGTVVSGLHSPPVLVERDGKLAQTVSLSLKHAGEPGEAMVRIEQDGKRQESRVALKNGAQTVELAVPAVERGTAITVTVSAGAKTLATREVTLKPVRKWVVYLLPHSHVDIGYTHVQTDVEKAQWKYLEMAMETARRTANNPPGARFKWNVEVLWAVDSYLRQATPEKQQQFMEAVKAGQVGLQALYGNELTGLCRPEEMLRLLSYAQRLSERCGRPIESAMITDVPGYTWGVVPAFAHSGVKYFSIGPNGGDRIGHTTAAWGDKPFWWVGPNGRDRVLVWMTGTGYYQVYQSAEKLTEYLRRLDEKGYPYDMVQVRHCLGDNGAPDVNFADKVQAWNSTHAYPKLVIATTEEMFHDFEQAYGDKIPTAKGDFTPYWEDGAASSALETAMNRASADRLSQAEAVYAMANAKAYPAEEFYQAWRNVILYDEHTWGAHNSISQPDHPFVKSQWAIKQAFAVDADRQSRKLLESALRARGEPVTAPSANMNVVDVINTTSGIYPYTLVVIPKELSTAGDTVKWSLTNSGSYRTQRLSSGELVFRICAGQFRSMRHYITEGKPEGDFGGAARPEGLTLAIGRSIGAVGLKLQLDEKTGAIASLMYGGHEYVDTNSPIKLNEYLYLPGSDLKGLQRNGPVKISVKEKGPLIASLLVESDAPGCRKLTREVRVHALRDYVEIIDTVDKLPVRAKEGVHFGFSFNVPNGVMRMDVPWGVVRPETDQIPGACKNWFTVQRWVDISNEERGITWFTPDAPLVQAGGITANLIGALPDTRAWKNRIEPGQSVYSWAMNNHWHTNYRAEQEGPTVFRYYLWPHQGYKPGQATRWALELSQPLVVAAARGEPRTGARLEVQNQNVIVTALKPSEDGRACIVRVFETAGKNTDLILNWSDPKPKKIWLSDNSEKPLKEVTKIQLPANSLVTLRAEW